VCESVNLLIFRKLKKMSYLLSDIDNSEISQLKNQNDINSFSVGDNIRIHVRIIEGEKQRVQIFEGVCIGKRGKGISKTFTVRRLDNTGGVERIFPIFTPAIEKIEVLQRGKVRRAKLNYLRALVGKKAKIKKR